MTQDDKRHTAVKYAHVGAMEAFTSWQWRASDLPLPCKSADSNGQHITPDYGRARFTVLRPHSKATLPPTANAGKARWTLAFRKAVLRRSPSQPPQKSLKIIEARWSS